MQLTGPEIEKRMNQINPTTGKSDIVIVPFLPQCLGSNSYDLHLSDTLKVYADTLPKGMKPAIPVESNKDYKKCGNMRNWFNNILYYWHYRLNPGAYDPRNTRFVLDPCYTTQERETIDIKIPETGLILNPFVGYLGSTFEYTETRNLFPYVDGKSSGGRNFILVHFTAGRGDDGFCGNWTWEMSVKQPTIVYPGMRIGQVYFEEFIGDRKPYDTNPNSHYSYQGKGGMPVPAKPMKIELMQLQQALNERAKQL